MITFLPCKADHFNVICHRPEQSEEFKGIWQPGYREALVASIALSVWHQGVCLGAAGVLSNTAWGARAEAWTLLGHGAGYFLLPIIRKMRFVLDNHPAVRVDMLVADGNGNGHSIAKLCGFTYEARLEGYHPSGADAHMYKRMRR